VDCDICGVAMISAVEDEVLLQVEKWHCDGWWVVWWWGCATEIGVGDYGYARREQRGVWVETPCNWYSTVLAKECPDVRIQYHLPIASGAAEVRLSA